MLTTFAVVAALALSVLPAGAAPQKNPPQGGVVELQVIQYSDWHGQLDPLSVFGEGNFGGAAQLATHFQQEEADNPNTLILTGGDDFGASPPLSSFFDEVPAVLSQNLMGWMRAPSATTTSTKGSTTSRRWSFWPITHTWEPTCSTPKGASRPR